MEGIEEKLLKSQENKIGQKYSKNHTKRKMGCTHGDEIQSQRLAILMKSQMSTRCGNHPNILPLFG
jgi:hypothetical protein